MRLIALLLLAAVVIPGHADQHEGGLESEYLMDIVLETAAPQTLGSRMIVPITGGRFEGSQLKGTILDGGGDWIMRRANGVSELDVRMTLKTDDGSLIYMTYSGVIARGESGMYWRTLPRFETDAEKYGWLEKVVSVGVGKRVEGKTAYSVYRIL